MLASNGPLMPKLTRIYTRTGDDGTTGLVGGQRVKKNALRIEAYGTVDECSSAIGLARTALADLLAAGDPEHVRASGVARELDAWLAWVQNILFNIGSDLATLPADRWKNMPFATDDDAAALERAIDRAQEDLEPLANFILPSGSGAAGFLHLARTIARRAERLLVTLAESDEVSPQLLRFINRLSDALFVWSRWINRAQDRPEALWDAQSKPPPIPPSS